MDVCYTFKNYRYILITFLLSKKTLKIQKNGNKHYRYIFITLLLSKNDNGKERRLDQRNIVQWLFEA